MPAFFDLLREEAAPGRPRGARALYLRLHPSLYGWQRPRGALPDEHDDGVGRIPVDGHSGNRPQAYMKALEKASVGEDIAPFADFLARLVKRQLAGEPLPSVPQAAKATRE